MLTNLVGHFENHICTGDPDTRGGATTQLSGKGEERRDERKGGMRGTPPLPHPHTHTHMPTWLSVSTSRSIFMVTSVFLKSFPLPPSSPPPPCSWGLVGSGINPWPHGLKGNVAPCREMAYKR